ncbi:hypothetical protein K492DRAFT_52430 [Lichtheimia hyalospora FSU 10163]|nr:hypothetical protein K492DRAFT_52430 [Lichtheimia hyalospora FSU 10163]
MSDDATLPYSPTQDDDYHSSLDHQHESPEISGTMDHDPTESGEKSGMIESEESKSIGPFHSSRSLNSADSESTRGSVLIGPMLASRDRENYPYGNHYQMQPKKHQSSGSIEEDDKIYFGIEYHDAAAVAKAIKSNNGIVSRLTIDTEPIPVMGKGSGKREPMFVNKDNDRKAEELLESKGGLFAKEEDRTHENMMEGSDHRRRAAYEADQAKQAYGVKKLENKRYFSAPNPQDGPSRQAMAMMKEGPKKRRHSEDTLGGDFGLGLGGSLGRALKEIDQPAKMRRYSTQSTMFLEEQSGDSEGIEQHLSFSDPSGQFSSFERQQYTDDNEDDRPRQASPAKSEASDVAAENKLIDVQVFGSYDVRIGTQ